MPETTIHLFGVRHHGPGSARSLLTALAELSPDCLLIEGPPEAEPLLELIRDPDLVPPVALLIYDPADPGAAVFYPFAEFSPEWQTLRFALQRDIPVRFMDLPAAHGLALEAMMDRTGPTDAGGDLPHPDNDDDGPSDAPETPTAAPAPHPEDDVADDPLGWLGRAAGHADGESWWNHLIEERGDGEDLFAAVAEAISVLRDEAPRPDPSAEAARREALREARMRRTLRQARRDGFERIAVVCGAWHVPALADLRGAKDDNALLKGLPKRKVEATWVPWTYRNLAARSGYGAGVEAPGWYEHLWQSAPEARAVGWVARAARVFRAHDLDCSSAHLIETVRLAEALAALRGRPHPGREELDEGLLSVVCHGNMAPMRLITEEFEVPQRLGTIPESAPAVPLQRDLSATQRRLRLKPEAGQRLLDLDLRKSNDLARSHLLHRLTLLGIDWGTPVRAGISAKGTFHEHWTLRWEPRLAVAVIEAARWGTTVADAAAARAIDAAAGDESLSDLSALVHRAMLADLPAALGLVTRALEDRAAVASDIGQMLGAIPPLVDICRYGNVRRTDAGMVEEVLDGLVPRAALGLGGACSALDDAAAETMRGAIGGVDQALRRLGRDPLIAAWDGALGPLAEPGACHGLVGGLAARLRYDATRDDAETTRRRLSLALSPGNDPLPAAAWLEGFLNRSALVLLHDQALWGLVDDWVRALGDERFLAVLPLLRRAFSAFGGAERRQLAERARTPGTGAAPTATGAPAGFDPERAERVVPLLRMILGLRP